MKKIKLIIFSISLMIVSFFILISFYNRAVGGHMSHTPTFQEVTDSGASTTTDVTISAELDVTDSVDITGTSFTDGEALNISATGTDEGIVIDMGHSANYGIDINTDANSGDTNSAGIKVAANASSKAMAGYFLSGAGSTSHTIYLDNDGTGYGFYLKQDGTAQGLNVSATHAGSAPAVYIDTNGTDDGIYINHTGGANANDNAIHINQTGAQGNAMVVNSTNASNPHSLISMSLSGNGYFFYGNKAGTSGDLVNLNVSSVEKYAVEFDGSVDSGGSATFDAGVSAATASFTATATLSSDLAVDTTDLLVDTSLNRVGIGTINPSTTLEVVGTVEATGYSADGNAGISQTISVRKGDDSGPCDLVFTDGILTGTTCP